MTAVELDFKTNYGSVAFKGELKPIDASRYSITGTLDASCKLDRRSTDVDNVVRLGHGGTSGEYVYLEYKLKNMSKETYEVKGEGKRALNESIDLRLGLNEGENGQFTYGQKKTYALEAATEEASDPNHSRPRRGDVLAPPSHQGWEETDES